MKNKYEKLNPPSMWSNITHSVSLSYSPLAGDSYLGGNMDIYEDQYAGDERARKLMPAALAVVISGLLAVIFVIGIGCKIAFGDDSVVKTRIVNAIIGEAEGEPYKGKVAVACAIQNRVRTFGSLDAALRGVYGERSERVRNRLYSDKTLASAIDAYEESLDVGTCDFIDGADHFESTSFRRPYWASKMIVTDHIGRHIFYKEAK